MPFKDKLKNREYQRDWYYKFHEARLRSNKATKKRYKQEGRCPSCSTKLIEGEKIVCINCSGNNYREFKYAKNSLRLAQKF